MKFLIAVVLVLATCVSVESIIGGTDVIASDFPYQVIVIVPKDGEKMYMGGGSVISNSWILTAAYCLARGNKSETQVLLGLNDNRDLIINVKAINVIMHEKYIDDKGKLSNDIGLVHIPPVTYNEYIRPIALSHTSSIVNQTVTVAGIGLTGLTSFSNKLQVTTMMVMDDMSCKNLLGQSFPNTQFCTNDINTSTCEEDGGGPVTIGSGLNLQQVGLVSNGLKKECVAGNPTSYTRISSYLEWINGKTGLIF